MLIKRNFTRSQAMQTPDRSFLILVVDDDPDIRELIGEFLGTHGYRIRMAANAEQMYQEIAQQRPDMVILDVMMPGEDGLSAARKLAGEQKIALIMLSALGSDTDRVVGLEIGADDYLAKPCNPRELLARVRAVLRRQHNDNGGGGKDTASYRFAGWSLDIMRRELHDPGGSSIALSEGEFSLLWTFVEHPQRVLSRDQLLDYTHRDNSVYDRAIDSQISRLRRKINQPGRGELIRTVRNKGYMLLPQVIRP